MAMNTPQLTASNAVTGVSGEIALAPLGTALPTSTTATPDAAFEGLGYFTSDGAPEEAFETSEESQTAWQNQQTILQAVTEAKLQYNATLAETKPLTIEVYYGSEVTQTAAHGHYKIKPGGSSGRMAMYFTKIYNNGKIRVVTCSDVEVFKNGSVKDETGKAVAYPIKIVCYAEPDVYDEHLATPAP